MAMLSSFPRFAAVVASCVLTLGCQSTSPDRFARADANHDEQLTRDEINRYLVTSLFDSRDTNHDGKLTKEEWVTGSDTAQEKVFRARDLNHDGFVTRDEAVAYAGKGTMADRVVRDADKNKDGKVSRQEMQAYYGSKE